MKKRIILAGGAGFLGRSLSPLLLSKEYEVVVLTRDPSQEASGVRYAQWDGKKIDRWAKLLDGDKAVVNLTGKSVNCRYSPKNRHEIIGSRVNSVRVLHEAIGKCANPPEAFVQAGSLAIYGHAGDRWCDENALSGDGFGADVCRV